MAERYKLDSKDASRIPVKYSAKQQVQTDSIYDLSWLGSCWFDGSMAEAGDAWGHSLCSDS
jgi:hypothetical protein